MISNALGFGKPRSTYITTTSQVQQKLASIPALRFNLCDGPGLVLVVYRSVEANDLSRGGGECQTVDKRQNTLVGSLHNRVKPGPGETGNAQPGDMN